MSSTQNEREMAEKYDYDLISAASLVVRER